MKTEIPTLPAELYPGEWSAYSYTVACFPEHIVIRERDNGDFKPGYWRVPNDGVPTSVWEKIATLNTLPEKAGQIEGVGRNFEGLFWHIDIDNTMMDQIRADGEFIDSK